MFIVAYLLLFASLSFIVLNIYKIGSERGSLVRRRLQQLQMRESSGQSAYQMGKSKKRNIFIKLLHNFIELFRKIGIEISEKEAMALNFISYLSLFLIMFLVSKQLSVAFVLGFIGLILPYLIVTFLARQRAKAFEKLFGDALYLIANTLRSGFSLRQALQIIAKEMPTPICEEFELLNQEVNWGLSLNEAMLNLGNRMPSEPVSLFVTAILIQNEVGGSLSDILGKIAETIRTKQEIRGEVKVLTAQGKVSGFIVGLMPFVISLFVFMVNPDYIMQLFTTAIGLAMITTALILEVIGIFAIKMIVSIE
ncbi:type II secretion system F family protein [Candidatus Margulisiibacteriota bacterium]